MNTLLAILRAFLHGDNTALLQAFSLPRIRDLWKRANISIQPIGVSAGLCVELISVIMNATTVYCQEASNDLAAISQ